MRIRLGSGLALRPISKVKISRYGFAPVASMLAIAGPFNAFATSFEQVINHACETHPSIAAANINLFQADTRIQEAKSLYLPTIRSVSEAGIAEDELPQGSGVSGSRPYSTQLILDQPLYIGGRAGAEVDIAKRSKDGLRYQGISQVIDVQSRAVLAYIELGRTLAVLKVRQENLRALKKQRDDSKRRFELGGGTKSNIVEVEARIARAEGNLISASTDVDQAQIALREAAGLYVESDVAVPAPADTVTSFKTAAETALSNNPQILVADQQIGIAEAAVERAKSERRPQLRLIGDLNAQRDTSFFGFERDEARLRLRLDVPIFEGGRLDARQRGSIFEVSRTRFDKAALTRRVIEQLQTEWNSLKEAERLQSVNRDLVQASDQALQAITREAFEGFRPNRDVLEAQQELLEAQLRLQQSRFSLTQASYRLQFAIGEIDEKRFPSCANAVLRPDDPSFEEPVRDNRIDLPVIGGIIGSEEGRRRRGPPNRR